MKHALVVDDSSVIRKIIRRMLAKLQFAVDEAEDAQMALEYCKTALPDLIMLDWNMPNMDGMEFLKVLRAMPGGDKPKVVFCTTENSMQNILSAIEAGADEYIMKPFDDEIVRTKLEQVGMLQSAS
jgi:two-component system, chemotaxis family, chemotaxis protein CheY